MTSLNALLARVRAAAESQQKFVADAAHQLRTPLAGMQAQLELLERDAAALPVREDDEVMIITDRGMVIRLPVAQISVIGRNTQGVRLITMDSREEKVVAVAPMAEKGRENGDGGADPAEEDAGEEEGPEGGPEGGARP